MSTPTETAASAGGGEGDLREKVEQVLAPLPDSARYVERVVEIFHSETFRSPIVHPKHLAAYESVHTGLADRIVAMAELAQERHEARAHMLLEQEFKDRRLGMFLGFGALCLVLVSGTILAVVGQTAIALVLLGASVVGAVISPFINGRQRSALPKLRSDREREDQNERRHPVRPDNAPRGRP